MVYKNGVLGSETKSYFFLSVGFNKANLGGVLLKSNNYME